MSIYDLPNNHQDKFDIFEVGDGVTMNLYSDCYAGTVVWVSPNGRRVKVQRDKAILDPNFKPDISVGGFAGHCNNQHEQSYSYERDLEGVVREYSLRKWRGRYVWTAKGGSPDGRQALSAGQNEFYDYNF